MEGEAGLGGGGGGGVAEGVGEGGGLEGDCYLAGGRGGEGGRGD